jgi:tetratricopeptide (TPR) repeat protein
LVGTASALAIFAFAESVFGAEAMKEMTKAGSINSFAFVKMVAWGVLSGYAGTRLLDPLSDKMVKRLAGDTARAEVDKKLTDDQVSRQSIREAEQLVARHITMVAGLSKHAPSKDAADCLDDAQRKYELVLKSDPANIPAQIGLANVHCYRGDYLRFINDAKRGDDSYAAAIKVVDALIKRDPNVAKAYYNRACYKAVAGDPPYAKDDAARDLIKAVELDPHLKDYAAGDKDLESLRSRHKDLPFLSKTPLTK